MALKKRIPKRPKSSADGKTTTSSAKGGGKSSGKATVKLKQLGIILEKLQSLSLEAKEVQWVVLNKASKEFVPLLVKGEKVRRVTDEEALALGTAKKEDASVPKAKYCCYCAGYTVFKKDNYLGIDRCIGCGISLEDYYIKLDNGWALIEGGTTSNRKKKGAGKNRKGAKNNGRKNERDNKGDRLDIGSSNGEGSEDT